MSKKTHGHGTLYVLTYHTMYQCTHGPSNPPPFAPVVDTVPTACGGIQAEGVAAEVHHPGADRRDGGPGPEDLWGNPPTLGEPGACLFW